MTTETPRIRLAWLIYCFNQGYVTPEDRAVVRNWMGDDLDPAKSHPNDIVTQAACLGMADEVLALLFPAEGKVHVVDLGGGHVAIIRSNGEPLFLNREEQTMMMHQLSEIWGKRPPVPPPADHGIWMETDDHPHTWLDRYRAWEHWNRGH